MYALDRLADRSRVAARIRVPFSCHMRYRSNLPTRCLPTVFIVQTGVSALSPSAACGRFSAKTGRRTSTAGRPFMTPFAERCRSLARLWSTAKSTGRKIEYMAEDCGYVVEACLGHVTLELSRHESHSGQLWHLVPANVQTICDHTRKLSVISLPVPIVFHCFSALAAHMSSSRNLPMPQRVSCGTCGNIIQGWQPSLA
jgi:hypothetical protein